MIFICMVAALFTLTTNISSAEKIFAGKKELSRDHAREVVLVFLKSQGYKIWSPHFDLEDDVDTQDLPEFYMFHAYYNTASRLDSIGSYAVNNRTADLWERVGCEEVKSKTLKQFQSNIRKRFGLSKIDAKSSSTQPCF